MDFYSRYAQITQDAMVWLNEKEPQWHLDEPIDRAAFLEDLLGRAGLSIGWHEGKCKSVLDQVANCYGIVDKEV
jgi:hypothetical protein